MKLQKSVNGHREVFHSAYGASWVIHDPINSPGGRSANIQCWVTVDFDGRMQRLEDDWKKEFIIPDYILRNPWFLWLVCQINRRCVSPPGLRLVLLFPPRIRKSTIETNFQGSPRPSHQMDQAAN